MNRWSNTHFIIFLISYLFNNQSVYSGETGSTSESPAKAKDFENTFLDGRRNNVPLNLKDNPAAIAFYNLPSEELKDSLASETARMDIAEEMAAGIDTVVTANVFDNRRPVTDRRKNNDSKRRCEIDDLLFETKAKYDLQINFGPIDGLIAGCIKVAETKYKRWCSTRLNLIAALLFSILNIENGNNQAVKAS